MTKDKRFVKYDGNTIVDLKLVRSWIISNGDVDLLIELLNKVEVGGWSIETVNDELQKVKKENEELKQVLGSILIEVKQEISTSHKTGEVRAFINPNSYNLISDVLGRYCALGKLYDD